jgi:ribonucleotide reductase alpha subunit
MKSYTIEEVNTKTLEYFKGDQLAADVWIKKYALTDNKGRKYELTPDDMHHRLAKEYSRIENNYPNPISEEEIFNLLKDFKFLVPAGSQLSGIGNPFTITSLSNCFVIESAIDSYGGIMKTDQEQIQLMKRRGGVGHDLSNLRPSGTLANNSVLKGIAGLTLYMERFSNSTREVSQGDRRGALMLSIDARHPDAEKFIDAKLESGKVTGANISVKITDEFMEAVKSESYFIQKFPIDLELNKGQSTHIMIHNPIGELLDYDNNYVKKIDAKLLWDKIIKNAHKSAEPGVLFWDTILRESPAGSYGEGWKESSTNPCVTGDTKILTNKGEKQIKDLVGKKPTIWNGEDWSIVSPKITGTNKKILRLFFVDEENTNYKLKCTEYHGFKVIRNGLVEEVEAKDLVVNDKLDSWFTPEGKYLCNVKLIKIEAQSSREKYVYCFNEPKKHMGIFNGICTAQCGEIPLCPYDSCRLLAINLYSYVSQPFSNDSNFDFDLFKNHVRKAQRLMDDLIDLEIEKIDKILNKIVADPEPQSVKYIEFDLWLKIKEKAAQGRRTGLGITAEGDMLAALGLKYGTPEATVFSVEVHKTLAIESYKSSIEMAEERGPFPMWKLHQERENPFINRVMMRVDEEIQIQYESFGRRNISNLTIAPTGSLSLLTRTTSGVEPLFAPYYKRRRKTTDSKVDFIDAKGDKWEEYLVFHDKFVEWFNINYYDNSGDLFEGKEARQFLETCHPDLIQKYFEESPYYQATANDVDWKESVKIQGDIQKWVDHSISKTINLPKGTTIETVDQLYRYAYEVGCKGITCYVDGSRDGVLIVETKAEQNPLQFKYASAFKRPAVTKCEILHKTALKEEWMVLVGLVDGNPYEIFALHDPENFTFHKSIEEGTITKIRSKVYELRGTFQDKQFSLPNIVSLMGDDEKTNTRKYSSMLRHGMDPQYIVDQIEEFASISSFDKVIQRTLRLYCKTVKKEVCPNCGAELRREEGCLHCISCEFSKCG